MQLPMGGDIYTFKNRRTFLTFRAAEHYFLINHLLTKFHHEMISMLSISNVYEVKSVPKNFMHKPERK